MYEPPKHLPWWWHPKIVDIVGLALCLAALILIGLTLPRGWHL